MPAEMWDQFVEDCITYVARRRRAKHPHDILSALIRERKCKTSSARSRTLLDAAIAKQRERCGG